MSAAPGDPLPFDAQRLKEVKILKYLSFVRERKPDYYRRLLSCASEVLGIVELPHNGAPNDAFPKKLPDDMVDAGVRAVSNYNAVLNNKPNDPCFELFRKCNAFVSESSASGTSSGGAPGTEDAPPPEAPPQQCDLDDRTNESMLTGYIRSVFQTLSVSESKAVAGDVNANIKSIADVIRGFYSTRSIFADLGRVPEMDSSLAEMDALKTFHEKTKGFLETISPDSPTIHNVRSLFMAKSETTTISGEKFVYVALRRPAVAKSAPVVFIWPPLKADEKALEAAGLKTIAVTTDRYMEYPRELEAVGLRVTASSARASTLEVPLENGEKSYEVLYVMENPWSFETRSGLSREVQVLYDQLNYIQVVDGAPPKFVPCGYLHTQQATEERRQAFQTSMNPDKNVLKKLETHNSIWSSYHRSLYEWEAMESNNINDKPILQIMEDILLLDMSRFGWAPCWSTPENAVSKNEDNPAATFFNDLATFSDTSTYGVDKRIFRQVVPQWKCTQHMHTTEFSKSRRLRFLRGVMNIKSEASMIKELIKLSNSDPALSGLHTWATGKWHDSAEEDNSALGRHRESFVSSMHRYHVLDTDNDVHALCICFTATFLRIRGAMRTSFNGPSAAHRTLKCMFEHAWYDRNFQFAILFRRFKWLAMKAASVPAHETLKLPPMEWINDYHKVAAFIKFRIDVASSQMNTVFTERETLCNDFLTHAKKAQPRATGETSTSDVIVNTGMTCGMATKTFDNVFVCSRARLRFASNRERDDAYTQLVESDALMSHEKAASLVNEWNTARLNAADEKRFFDGKQKKIDMAKFVRTFYRGLVPIQTRAIAQAFVSLAMRYRVEPLEHTVQEGFLCDVPMTGVLSLAASKEPALTIQLKAAEKVRYNVTAQEKRPTCFKDPFKDTDILLVFMVPIDKMLAKVRRRGSDRGSLQTLLADTEIDAMLASLLKDCPRHGRPSERVQTAFGRVLPSQRVDVWRMDWWVGTKPLLEIDSYEVAATITPILPYGFSESQLRMSTSDVTHSSTASTVSTVPQQDPFREAKSVADSMQALSEEMGSRMQDFVQYSSMVEEQSIVGGLFSPQESRLEIEPRDSLGRVCRIAFGLLIHGPLTETDGSEGSEGSKKSKCRFAEYLDVWEASSGFPDKDFLAYRLEYSPRLGVLRSTLDASWSPGAAVLPPFQHEPFLRGGDDKRVEFVHTSEQLSIDTTTYLLRADVLSIPQYATGIFRFLQWRISTSSYYVKYLRDIAFQDQGLTRMVERFEIEAQAASKYKSLEVQRVDPTDNTYKDRARVLATFLFPIEFAAGRETDDVANTNPDRVYVLSDDKNRKYAALSELYMACCVSNLKSAVLETATPIVPTSGVDDDYTRFARIAAHMAAIAEGVRKAGDFFRYMFKAAKAIRNKNNVKYRWAPSAVESVLKKIEALCADFESNHAKFEDAVRSYSDMASTGIKSVGELVERFTRAYKSVRSFRRTYDVGANGMLVYMASKFKTATYSEGLKSMLDGLFFSLELIMTSDAFEPKSSSLAPMFSDESKLVRWFEAFDSYTKLSSRVHVNAALGCATAAAPFRRVRDQTTSAGYLKQIRSAVSFDTFGGFFDKGGNFGMFYCYLPTASDVLVRGVQEKCHPDQKVIKKKDAVAVVGNEDKDDEDDDVYDFEDDDIPSSRMWKARGATGGGEYGDDDKLDEYGGTNYAGDEVDSDEEKTGGF